jgi:hypothetical protein
MTTFKQGTSEEIMNVNQRALKFIKDNNLKELGFTDSIKFSVLLAEYIAQQNNFTTFKD